MLGNNQTDTNVINDLDNKLVFGANYEYVTIKTILESINMAFEDKYWEENYHFRAYVSENESYELYRAAYHYGIDAFTKHDGKHFNEVESELSKHWYDASDYNTLPWIKAKHAARDAYQRLYHRMQDNKYTGIQDFYKNSKFSLAEW